MLLLKSTYKINNTLRFLISLTARAVRLNSYTRVGLLFILFVALTNKGFAQQDCTVPYIVDLSANPNFTYTQIGVPRSGNCDGGSNCISYKVLINPGTDVLSIQSTQPAASDHYWVDGDGPNDIRTTACVSGKSFVIITFCKPGNNSVDIIFTATAGFGVSSGVSLRPGCTGTISATGLITNTIQWTAIYPTDNIPLYNSYLSATSNTPTVTVAPTAAAPGGYIDYQVTGIEQSPCNTIHKTGVVRVYTYPALTVSLTSSASTVCSGNPVTLTATPNGGNPAYTYLWSTNETTQSISVNTAGWYSVTVSDQLSNCGPATNQIYIAAATPVPPTAPPVTICTGNQAPLNATGPGGPYQWYDGAGNPIPGATGASYLTPTLTTGTYNYYVMTSNSGCPSARTLVKVTVLATSPAPTAPPVTVCTGNPATLSATGPGGPYQWYDGAGNPVGDGISASYSPPMPLAPNTYSYSVTSSVSGCPGLPTTVTLTVLPTPPPPTAPPVSTCSGQQAVLNATGGGPYQWYDQAGNPIPGATGTSYQAPLLPPGTYTYYVTGVTNGCTSARTPVTVTVLPTPPGPTAPPVNICSGNYATLQATAPGGPYQWYDPSGNPVGNGSATYQTVILTTGATNTVYPYTVTTSNGGCTSQSTTVPVTVSPNPATPTVQAQ